MLKLLKITYRVTKKIIAPVLIVGLLVTNGLSLFNADFHDLLYAALAKGVPNRWVRKSPTSLARAADKRRKLVKSKVRKITKRVAKRTVKNITANIAGVPIELVPIVGEALVIAITLNDIRDACEDMKDMDKLKNLFEIKTEADETKKVCGLKLPD